MAINLLELIKPLLRSILGPLAGLIGESEQKTESALEPVLSTILGGLMQKASTPTGAADVFNALKGVDTGVLDNLASQVSGGSQSSLMQLGAKLLPMLLGSKQSNIVGSLTKSLGLGNSSVTSLLTAAAPIVIAYLGKQVKSQGLNAQSLASLLGGQKDILAKALPGDLTRELGLGAMAQRAGDAAKSTAREAAAAAPSIWNYLLPLLLLLLLGGLLWYFFNQGAPPKAFESTGTTTVAPAEPSTPAEPMTPAVEVPDLSAYTGPLNTTFDDLVKVVTGIKDEATATEAVAKIGEATKTIQGLGLDNVPQAGQSAIGKLISEAVGKLSAAVETAYAIPGVEAILKPVIDPLMQMFDKYTAWAQ